jgi:signal transduction histidine kinase
MKRDIRIYYWVLGGTVAILFVIALLAFRNLRGLIEYGEEVEQTQRLLNQAEELLSNLKDAETGQRGFIITKDGMFIHPYNRSHKSIESGFQEAHRLVDSASPQAVLIDSLEKIFQRRKSIMEDALGLSPNVILTNDSLRYLMVKGHLTMDSARTLVDTLKRRERASLKERLYEKGRVGRAAPYYFGVISVLAIGLFAVSFFFVIKQLVQRWNYEAELERKVKELERSNNELETFAYVASHDLQEPLRKLRTFTDRLRTKYKEELSEDTAFLVSRVHEAATRMQSLIDDLLAFSRLVRPNAKDNFGPVDLNDAVSLGLDEFSELTREKKAEVRILQPLPVIYGSHTQMVQLFSNLLSNSLKFSKPGQPPLITLSAEFIRGDRIAHVGNTDRQRVFHKILFSDNGIGFDEGFKEKIFVIFQRLHDRSAYGGSGIGLSMCKKIVDLHNGYIDVTSQPEQGTTFIIYLPVYNSERN